MTYYIKAEAIQNLLNNGDITTYSLIPDTELHSTKYIEHEVSNQVAAELFRIGTLKPPRTKEPWSDREIYLLHDAYRNGIDLTQIALALERTEGAIYAKLHYMYAPEDRLPPDVEKSLS